MASLLNIFARSRGFAPRFSNLFRGNNTTFVRSPILRVTGIASVGLGLSVLGKDKIYCDPSPEKASGPASRPQLPEAEKELGPSPPLTSVSIYELSFGTVAGICAGIFIKKGVKTLAFLLGAAFVLLQYLGSVSMLRVDWARMEHRFEEIFYVEDDTGKKRPPAVTTVWRALLNFVMADFPPRASFLAGLVLGLRIG